MATYGQTVRRGLPRRPGGDPWPADGMSPVVEHDGTPTSAVESAAQDEASAGPAVRETVTAAAVAPPTAVAEPPTVAAPAAATLPASTGAPRIRRGLPRVAGGEPWPPDGVAPVASVVAAAAAVDAPAAALPEPTEPSPPAPPTAETVESPLAASVVASVDGDRPLRRGLPRTPGGEPWPPAGFAPAPVLVAVAQAAPAQTLPAVAAAEVAAPAASAPAIRQGLIPATAPAAASGVIATDVSVPLPFTRTVFPGPAAVVFERERRSGALITAPEPQRIGRFTRLEWAGIVVIGGAGLLFAAGMAVVAVRFLLSLPPFQDFLAAYPGEYPLPEGAPVGIPPWLGWQHFFNTFLIVLIIRSGLQVRTEKRPSVFWSPRNNGKRKISLNLWFHQSLDILWITNGLIYIVLLFVTGQWMKIVPTSWAVFPNAISAGLQYVSLDWPTENGWVNYNSLQQLAYFATVFIAAPLAIATGVRMSGIWPKNAQALNRAYPVEWARAIHFPVMLYFVAFILTHVALVLATGALRNLNHMYASQDAINWVGFFIFAASLIVIVIGWIAARPLVLAPIARLFGKVSGR